MDEVKKMLRAVINGQSALKTELLDEIREVDNKVENHRKETRKGFKEVNKRIDKIGKQVAYLEDDTPTRDEHNKLVRRVDKLEEVVAHA